jgi:hypothetical protein
MTPAVAQRGLEEAFGNYEQKIRRAIAADIGGLAGEQNTAQMQLNAARDSLIFAMFQAVGALTGVSSLGEPQ